MARGSSRTRADRRAEIVATEDAEEVGTLQDPAPPRRQRSRAKPQPIDEPPPRGLVRRLIKRLLLRGVLVVIAAVLGLVALLGVVNPPTTPYMWSEGQRLGSVDQAWVSLDDIAPAMARSAVAAEDANFCAHWGLDLAAIRAALADGGDRGGSTISQQVAKNVFLWHGRNWLRKSLEAAITPVMEAFWSKRRILEVYLNVAEFGEGVFGIEAAARHWFGVPASELTDVQAARLAAILPAPKSRDPANPTDELRARARAILDGAATIAADGRSACFEGASP